jgi:hypothetical protein
MSENLQAVEKKDISYFKCIPAKKILKGKYPL